VLAKSLQQRSTHPVNVLAAVARVAPLCPGLCSLVEGQLLSGFAGSGQPPHTSDLAGFLNVALMDVAPTAQHQSGSSSSNNSSIAAVKAHGNSLALLIGRALHVAAHALLQLHEQAGAAAAGPSRSAQMSESAQLGTLCTAVLLTFYLAALGPLL
jgi:hypothetical protein